MLGSSSNKRCAADKGDWLAICAASVWGVQGSPSFCSRRELLTELLGSPALGPSTSWFRRCNTANTIRPQRTTKHQRWRRIGDAQNAILPVKFINNFRHLFFSISIYMKNRPTLLISLNASQMNVSLWSLHHSLACVCRTSGLNAKIILGYILLPSIPNVLSFTPMSLISVCYQMFVITSQKWRWCRRRWEGVGVGVGGGGRRRIRKWVVVVGGGGEEEEEEEIVVVCNKPLHLR